MKTALSCCKNTATPQYKMVHVSLVTTLWLRCVYIAQLLAAVSWLRATLLTAEMCKLCPRDEFTTNTGMLQQVKLANSVQYVRIPSQSKSCVWSSTVKRQWSTASYAKLADRREHVTHLPGTFAAFLFQNCFLFPSVDILPLRPNQFSTQKRERCR